MTSADRVHALLAQGRVTCASTAVAGAVEELRRFAAGIFALAGAEKAMAGAIDPHLLGANGRGNGYLDTLPGGAQWFDYAAAAVANSWTGDEAETRGAWRAAARIAPPDAPHLAVALYERIAHHALIFGNLLEAHAAAAVMFDLAAQHGLHEWRRVAAATIARLAMAAGDLARAERLASEAASQGAGVRALFAPVGVRLALASRDTGALQTWASPEMLDVALNAMEIRSSVGAAMACVHAAG